MILTWTISRDTGASASLHLQRPGDITTADTVAIVNAANPALVDGGGVAGAIFAAVRRVNGGKDPLTPACEALPIVEHPATRPTSWGGAPVRCPTGEARITPAFGIGGPTTRFILHAAGPNASEYPTDGDVGRLLLAGAYTHALQLAAEHQLASVTFPALSAGIYGYSGASGAVPATDAVVAFLGASSSVASVTFVFRAASGDDENYEAFRAALAANPHAVPVGT